MTEDPEADRPKRREGNGKEEKRKEAAAANIFSLYEHEIGLLTPMIAEALEDAEKTYPKEWFELAFQEAVTHNARSWKYIDAILKRWQKDGFQSKNGKPSNSSDSGQTYRNPLTGETMTI